MKNRTRMVRWAVGLAGAGAFVLAWGVVRGSNSGDDGGSETLPAAAPVAIYIGDDDDDGALTLLPQQIPAGEVRTRTRGS